MGVRKWKNELNTDASENFEDFVIVNRHPRWWRAAARRLLWESVCVCGYLISRIKKRLKCVLSFIPQPANQIRQILSHSELCRLSGRQHFWENIHFINDV